MVRFTERRIFHLTLASQLSSSSLTTTVVAATTIVVVAVVEDAERTSNCNSTYMKRDGQMVIPLFLIPV
jgi:predicted CoA-binding protein